jgi:AcrR family transcriptional regulator
MAVYTHFGGMSGLIREMVHEGFARLQRHFSRVRETDDPVADMALLGRAYRRNGMANPHLYAVMFGASSISGFSLSRDGPAARPLPPRLRHALRRAVHRPRAVPDR